MIVLEWPEVKPSFDFVPVIFANGEDDDLPGLVAAFKNERVQYEDKIYKPDEDIEIDGKRMALSCNCLSLEREGDELFQIPPVEWYGRLPRKIRVSVPATSNRTVNISNSTISMNHQPMMGVDQ